MTNAAGSRGDASNSTDAPAVTVVTATYNNSVTLRLALRSLLLQEHGDFEAWVVGDACTDDSGEVVASFADPRLHWFNLPRNSGSQSGPNNEGLRRARGEYVAYLGHDDLWFPWHLSGLLAFARERGADLVHPLSAVLGPRGLSWIVGPPGRRRTYADHFVYPSSWLHRRGLWEECGPWRDPEGLGTGVDMDYLRRIHRAGKRIAFLQQLSVLKFPSAHWRMYALPGEPPQHSYLRALEDDPEALHRRLLLEIATAYARERWARPSPVELGRGLLRSTVRELLDLYGRERWPLRPLWRWHYQRARRRLRARRGLPRDEKNGGAGAPPRRDREG